MKRDMTFPTEISPSNRNVTQLVIFFILSFRLNALYFLSSLVCLRVHQHHVLLKRQLWLVVIFRVGVCGKVNPDLYNDKCHPFHFLDSSPARLSWLYFYVSYFIIFITHVSPCYIFMYFCLHS